MPTHAGPNNKGEESLVFAYDTGDTVNCYKGEPTTNLVTGGSDVANCIAQPNSTSKYSII